MDGSELAKGTRDLGTVVAPVFFWFAKHDITPGTKTVQATWQRQPTATDEQVSLILDLAGRQAAFKWSLSRADLTGRLVRLKVQAFG